MSTLEKLIRARLDKDANYPIQLEDSIEDVYGYASGEFDALRAVLDLHSPGDGEVREGFCVETDHPNYCRCDDVVIYRCPVCVKSWAYEETQTAPCETVRAIAAALGVTP